MSLTDLRGLAAAVSHHVAAHAEETAIVLGTRVVTYHDLGELISSAEHRLLGLDVAPRRPIGLRLEKAPEAIALVLACMSVGRRFLLPSPRLDPSTLRHLFESSGCTVVLSETDEEWLTDDRRPADSFVDDGVDHDGVTFMLTTSGSTGLPKVVPIPDRAVALFADWSGRHFGIGVGTRVLNYAPLNFDLCLLDIWSTLHAGGTVVLVPEDDTTNGNRLAEIIAINDVSVVQAVPMCFALMAERSPVLAKVDHVMFTGDAIPAQTLDSLPEMFPNARIHNIYGCTETNDSFIHELHPDTLTTPVPIGHPIPGVATHVVADDGTIIDGAGRGELHVSTPFQTRGYLDPSRNVDRFGPDPSGRTDAVFFRTGDIVERDADGGVRLVGRSDHQVKVRGTAVNTAQVEQVLSEHPDCVEAAVIAVADPIAGKKLVAVLRRLPGSGLNSLVMRKHCADNLPRAAVPTAMHIGDELLPRTSTGKVDRQRITADLDTASHNTTD